MIKKIVQINKSNTVLSKADNIQLSIQFNLDGFSFCVQNSTSKEILYFSEYIFDSKQTTPESLLKKIEHIFETDAQLQKDFDNVLVIHQNDLYTLVPQTYFKEECLSDYLQFTIKTLKTDFIAFDTIKTNEFYNVYVPYININNYLFQNFGAFTYKHHVSVLIEKLINQNTQQAKTVYVNVSKSSIDIIVIDTKTVLLANSFHYYSKEDFIYYILFVYEQLTLDTEKTALFLIGKINVNSEIYKLAYTYVRNVFFKESKSSIFNTLESSKHEHYILLGQ
ncbi:DUF3822 family protein [Polaribacter sp. WD7]|uniref:DUF3822 family protein n=1 Tax=Polaribacter sp. WD7 TaxID=2269061 RepID=UPI000DF467AC|nr:DUF3822 family protein [Polaribacter sp. WD7]RCS28073.1 DUF3822 family protein [Polaribacter sp. WD7]